MSDARFWDKAAGKYATDPIAKPDAYEATLSRMREILQPHHRVLEIGCGTGSTAFELASGVESYLGTDVSPAMIDIARGKSGSGTPIGLRFDVAEAMALPAREFDVVLALNLLHLVRDLEGLVAGIHDLLPPGGLFIAKTSLIADGTWFLPVMIPLMRAIGKAPYVRNLRRDAFEDILKDAGFELTESFLQPDTAPRLFTVARRPG